MLRLSKLTDYGTVVLAALAREPERMLSAADLAARTQIAPPTVSKLLKLLSRGGLVQATRGAHGGYTLARDPEDITAVHIIDAIEGPVALTECSGDHSQCGIEAHCAVGTNWQRINLAIREALKGVSLAQLARPSMLSPATVKVDVSALTRRPG